MVQKVLDFHTHIGNDKDGTGYTLGRLLMSMDEAQVTHAAVFPFDERDMTVEDASLALRLKAQGHPFYPLFRFDPNNMTPERLRERLNGGFYGAKLHPRSQNFDPLDTKFFSLYEVISASGKPVLFHTRYESDPANPGQVNPKSNPDRIVQLAEEFPDLYLVIGHFGNVSSYVMQMMQRHPATVYLETSVLGSTPKTIEVVASRVGADRLLFGSDVPYSDQLIERMKVDRSALRRADKEKLLYYNAANLMQVY